MLPPDNAAISHTTQKYTMKKVKFLLVPVGLLAFALLPEQAQAADVVDMVAAGSSAQLVTFTTAFTAQGYGNHYSLGTSPNFQIAPAVPALAAEAGVPNQNAQVAIYWQGGPGSYRIAVYYQVDSAVGVRAFFNSDTVTAPPTASGIRARARRGANGPSSLASNGRDVVPPDEVLRAVNGSAVNVGVTDITPEDARVATERAINLGYSPGNPIRSTDNADATVFPVRFDLSARPFTLVSLGAAPLVVFVNAGPNFGTLSSANLNIDSFTLAGLLSGQLSRTSDLLLTQGAVAAPVHTLIGEPLSGTYNVMEYCNTESLAKISSTGGRPSGSVAASGGQELNVSATANNPLNEPASGGTGPAGSGRIRIVGDAQRIKNAAVDSSDVLSYAFWSVGNFSGQAGLRYLTVDGADPLQDSYTGGSLTNVNISFRNIINGGYPLWSILRVVTQPSPSAAVSAILASVQGADQGADFVSPSSLRVFRSFHQTPFTAGGASGISNGNNGTPAVGGDIGGAVLTINNDQNAFNDFGGDLTNRRQ